MKSLFCSLILFGAAMQVPAAILVNRGLPASANVNDAAGANRSNVTWANYDGFINGDSFVTGDWVIDAITVWAVGSSTAFNNYQLYTRINGGNFASLGVSPTVTQAFYQPSSADPCSSGSGVSYQGSLGACLPIIQMRFSGLNIAVNSGDTFYFAADANPLSACPAPNGSVDNCFFPHATNAALAGVTQDQSNNLYINFDTSVANGDPLGCNSAGTVGNGCDGGWDKGSDINVLVEGRLTAVPEPSTIGLMTLGLGGLAFGYRRRRS